MGVVRAMRQLVAGDSVESLKRELAELRREAADALAAAEKLDAQRLVAETYQTAQSLERQAAEARWRADRIAAHLPALEDRLAAAQAREQAAALDRARTRWRALYTRLRDAVEAAAAIQGEVIEADRALCAELGEHLVRRHLPALAFRGLILPDLVQLWRDEMDRVVLPARASATPAPGRAPRRAPPERPEGSTQHAVRLERERPVPKAPKQPDDVSPLEGGECRVKVLRSGFEAPDGSQCHTGRVIRLPKKIADAAEKNGAVTIIESLPLLTV